VAGFRITAKINISIAVEDGPVRSISVKAKTMAAGSCEILKYANASVPMFGTRILAELSLLIDNEDKIRSYSACSV
jgi:hypothetical protein